MRMMLVRKFVILVGLISIYSGSIQAQENKFQLIVITILNEDRCSNSNSCFPRVHDFNNGFATRDECHQYLIENWKGEVELYTSRKEHSDGRVWVEFTIEDKRSDPYYFKEYYTCLEIE